jgi:hypothetical protein
MARGRNRSRRFSVPCLKDARECGLRNFGNVLWARTGLVIPRTARNDPTAFAGVLQPVNHYI